MKSLSLYIYNFFFLNLGSGCKYTTGIQSSLSIIRIMEIQEKEGNQLLVSSLFSLLLLSPPTNQMQIVGPFFV
jgi:hypothetical protein